MKPFCVLSLLLLAGVAACQDEKKIDSGLGKWFDQYVLGRIELTGWRRLGYHTRTLTGDLRAFDLAEYGGQGLSKFTDLGQVHVQGNKVGDIASFEVNFQDSRFQDPQADRFSVDVQRGPWVLNAGDIRGRLGSTNRFARFERALSGVQVGYRTKGTEIRALRTEARGQARTISLQGANSAGPYYLQSSQIVRGSEQVEVDGVKQVFGQDYTIDYDLGAVTFVNRTTLEGRIIPPTSTIVATYEAFGITGSRGRIEGVAVSQDFGKMGRVGLTTMRQVTGGSNRDSTRLEKFQGFGPPSTPYVLQFQPDDVNRVVIRVNGILQRIGVDYRFDAGNPSIFFFNRFIPSTDNIDVLYTPKRVDTVVGDREVVGVDYRVPLGGDGAVTYTQALGRSTSGGSPLSGLARGVDVNYNFGKVQVVSSVRDVPRGYVGVESAGFNRNERAWDTSLTYTPSSKWRYDLAHRNASVGDLLLSQNAPKSVRATSLAGSVTFTPSQGGAPWTLEHRRSASGGSRPESSLDVTSFGTTLSSKRWSTRFDLQNQFGKGSTTVNGEVKRRAVDLQTINARTSYRSSADWQLDGSLGLSRVSTEDQSGLGREVQLGASYRRGEKFSLRMEATDSDAGPLATLGFDSGQGAGYDGNGFSSGVGSTALIGATNARALSLRGTYMPTDRFNTSAGLYLYRSQGAVSSNSETRGAFFDATFRVPERLDLNARVDLTDTRFIESPLTASATTLTVYAGYTPYGRLSLRGGATALLTGGNSKFRQDSWSYDFDAVYRLAPRQNLVFNFRNGISTGFQSQQVFDANLVYQYQIWRSLALNVGFRYIDVKNRDPLVQSGAYSSRGLDLELSFNFGR
ncbi:MAG: hypothetical protein KIT11_08450 [Fimbriimonadaceae bacterium]|nr:hypothetical protein [Fimbriimonadaceae bacterium]QYK56383.1 MAG: hypothetical protein KF733_02645 [Fimbriimonadaceae bacterium]